jgi:hypothetical protein
MLNDQLKTREIIEAQDMVIMGNTWQQIYERTGITQEMFQEIIERLSQ